MSDLREKSVFEEIWEGDKLGRDRDADTIRRFSINHLDLRERAGLSRTYVLNLDADWGGGKSFFLTRFKRHLQATGHISVYINAWEDDHSDDPFLTVIDAIKGELEISLPEGVSISEDVKNGFRSLGMATFRVLGGATVSGAKYWLKRKVGEQAFEQLSDALNVHAGGDGEEDNLTEEAIDRAIKDAVDAAGAEMAANFKIQRDAQRSFKDQLESLSQKVLADGAVNKPIFVLIDELDRCRPSYAIELLERVKHIFSLKDFVFVLGTDTSQLAQAVRGVYGQGFDGPRYLKRFIDRTYRFQAIDEEKFVDFMFESLGLNEEMFTVAKPYTAKRLSTEVFIFGDRSLRDIEQLLEQVATFVAIWPSDVAKIDLLTLLVLLHKRQSDVDDDCLNGDFGKCELAFNAHKQNDSGKRSIKLAASAAGAYPESDVAPPTSSFHSWLSDKRHLERRAFRDILAEVPRRITLVELYESLLDRVIFSHTGSLSFKIDPRKR